MLCPPMYAKLNQPGYPIRPIVYSLTETPNLSFILGLAMGL